MSLPSERTMPTIEAVWTGRSYRVLLPGNVERIAHDIEHARAIVAREAPGSALRLRGPAIEEQAPKR